MPMRAPFQTEQSIDFSLPDNRDEMLDALQHVGSQLGRDYPLVIGGERRETGDWITSVNPGQPRQIVGRVAKAGPKDIEAAIAAGEKAFDAWRKMSQEGRSSVMFRMAGIVRQRKIELAAWLAYELDKAWDEAEGEVSEAIDFLEWYGRRALDLAELVPLAHLPNEVTDYRYRALGVGSVIPPWNFPCAIFTGMTMGPVSVGNTVILKPASNTPVIGYKLFEIMEEAGVPAGVVNFVPGDGSAIGDLMVDHPKIHFVAFTGSKDVGIRIIERAAKVHKGQRWIKRVTAEMGGKDAIIVDRSANIDAAVEGIVTSAWGFQGQKCSACSRALVHADVYDRVVDGIVERTRRLVTVGPGTDGDHIVGAVVDKNQYNAIREYIDVGAKEGRLVYQGEVPDGLDGYYIPPTIYADVPRDARIACEEIFGPVLAIVKVEHFEEALDVANDSEYGLTGSVYAIDRTVLERARLDYEVGNLYFNRKCTGAMVGIHPFAGVKLSGTNSKAGGPDYLHNYVEAIAVGERVQ